MISSSYAFKESNYMISRCFFLVPYYTVDCDLFHSLVYIRLSVNRKVWKYITYQILRRFLRL
jgi:hypothetical protein